MTHLGHAPAQALVDAGPRTWQRLARAAVVIVLGSLLVALTAQIEVELRFSPVPITAQTFGVMIIGLACGSRLGAATLGAYLLEGAAGMPVFAGGASGWAVISGPTGGYLLGFVAAAFAIGWLTEHGWDRNSITTSAAMAVGSAIIYAAGMARLQSFVGLGSVWALGMRDFLPGDAIKIVLAAGVLPGGRWLRDRLGALAARSPEERR